MKNKKTLLLFTVLLLSCVIMLSMLPVSASGNAESVGTPEEFLAVLENENITEINITASMDLTTILPINSYPLGVLDVS